MLKTTKIDFYIDSQNQAIPAAIAASYMDMEGIWEEQRIEKSYLPLYNDAQATPVYDWRRIAAAIGITSIGAFGLTYQPLFSVADNQPIAQPVHFSTIQAQSKPVSAPAAIAAPESQAQPNFSHHTTDRTVPSAATELLQQAQSFSSKALTFSKSAQSIDDWSIVASQWQKAITSLAAIPSNHVAYTIAQQKLSEYRLKLREAQKKANQPIVEAPMPVTTVYRPESQDKKADQQTDQQQTAQQTDQQTDQPNSNAPVSAAAVQRPATDVQPAPANDTPPADQSNKSQP